MGTLVDNKWVNTYKVWWHRVSPSKYSGDAINYYSFNIVVIISHEVSWFVSSALSLLVQPSSPLYSSKLSLGFNDFASEFFKHISFIQLMLFQNEYMQALQLALNTLKTCALKCLESLGRNIK